MVLGVHSPHARKRQRLSSPDYNLNDDLDDDVLVELDRIETMSQLVRRSEEDEEKSRPSRRVNDEAKRRRLLAIEMALTQEGHGGIMPVGKIMPNLKHRRQEDEHLSQDSNSRSFEASTSSQGATRVTAKEAPDFVPSQEGRSRVDEDEADWFADSSIMAKDAAVPPPVIMTARTVDDSEHSAVGFVSANWEVSGKVKAVEISAEALQSAASMMKTWSEEIESGLQENRTIGSSAKPVATPVRPVLETITNKTPLQTPLIKSIGQERVRAFKMPSFAVSNIRDPRTPERSIGNASPRPPQAVGSVSAKRAFRTPFKTPFKTNMAPGEPGRAKLEREQQTRKALEKVQKTQSQALSNIQSKKTNRIPLKSSGLVPQQLTIGMLESYGINIYELSRINMDTAPYYEFLTESDEPMSQVGSALGPTEALRHLQQTGRRKGVTQKWVNNQWALILWKLAGLVCLEPKRKSPFTYTWCWRSVLSQLEKHYDYELRDGHRPALRRITTGDSPAGAPLVLLVTKILWKDDEHKPLKDRVLGVVAGEIEVSDGWYCLKAAIDSTLATAIRRGRIKPGRKLAISGATLENTKKDPVEVLDAYNCCTLGLSGNGTHLAPWHAKLGFQPNPFIATLHSLSPDGGLVPFLHLVIIKSYDTGYLEYTQDADGQRKIIGPRNESDERVEHEKWQKQRNREEHKLREELNTRWARWEGFAERLEQRVGKYNAEEDKIGSRDVEDLFDNLDELPHNQVTPFLSQLSPAECYWLAQYFRQRVAKDKETAMDEIDLELNKQCPPREIRSVRICRVRDAETKRRPANRIALLTIWNVLDLCVAEGSKPGHLPEGQRFFVTNLQPREYGSWMGKDKDAEIFLTTRRDSRFIWSN